MDGNLGHTYLIISSHNLLADLVGGVWNLLGIQSVEPDHLLLVPQVPQLTVPPGLYATMPMDYYGTVVWHGYAAQPATEIIRLRDAPLGFNVSGAGIVAVIDTGVDTNHLVLYRASDCGLSLNHRKSVKSASVSSF